MAADPLIIDQVLSIRMTRAQARQCKAHARAMKLRFGVWARMVLVQASDPSARGKHTNGATNGASSHPLLTTPVLPVRGG